MLSILAIWQNDFSDAFNLQLGTYYDDNNSQNLQKNSTMFHRSLYRNDPEPLLI